MPRAKIRKRAAAASGAAFPDIGLFFRERRLRAGIGEEATASYLGISVPTLRQYEGGRRDLPLNSIYALANFLNVDPVEISNFLSSLPRG